MHVVNHLERSDSFGQVKAHGISEGIFVVKLSDLKKVVSALEPRRAVLNFVFACLHLFLKAFILNRLLGQVFWLGQLVFSVVV